MTISSISSMASPANAYPSHMKRHGQSDTALHFGHRFGSFDSDDSFGSDDSFAFPSPHAAKSSADEAKYSEEKAAVPSSRTSQTDTASLNSQRTRKRDRILSMLPWRREAQSAPATPFPVSRPGGQRRWSLPEQPSAQRESIGKRLGNWLKQSFRSRENSLTQAASDDAAIRRRLEELYQLECESSLSLPPSSASGIIATPPSSNDFRTTL